MAFLVSKTMKKTSVVCVNYSLSQQAVRIAGEQSKKHGCTISAWIDWVILSQKLSDAEANAISLSRRGRGRPKKTESQVM